MKLLAPKWQMMTDPQLTGYFANFMVEVSREHTEEVEADGGRRLRGGRVPAHATIRRSRHLLRGHGRSERPRRPAHHGPRRAIVVVAQGVLREARQPGPARHPLRQPRRRPVDQGDRPAHRRPAAAEDGPLVPRHAQPGGLHAGGHGRRRRRAARPPGHRHGAHRRRLDGRHDRAGLRRPSPRPHQDAGDDLLQQQPAAAAAAGTASNCWPSCSGPKDATREAIIENAIRVSRIIGSPGYPAPEERIRAEAIEGYDRAYYPAGVGRHFAAILGSGSLLRYDRQITAPTVVIHGKADKLMRPFGGRAIARAIKGARLVLFDGMGHELPERAVGRHRRRAEDQLRRSCADAAVRLIRFVSRRHRTRSIRSRVHQGLRKPSSGSAGRASDQPERHRSTWLDAGKLEATLRRRPGALRPVRRVLPAVAGPDPDLQLRVFRARRHDAGRGAARQDRPGAGQAGPASPA